MSQTAVVDFVAVDELPVRLRVGVLLDRALFGSLLFLICVTAIPYGTSQPWWKALFICFVLLATIAAVIEVLVNGARRIDGMRLILPAAVLILFAFLQTISLPATAAIPASVAAWNTISADPYETRFAAMQIIALMLVALLVFRYANTERRRRVLIHVVLGVAVTSAIYGILRQTVQRDTGFILPLLRPGSGYGQFINKNHFAYLMEMAFGLGLGLIVFGGVKRKHAMLYVAILLPVWTALVLSNSRGGILAMVGQLVIAALLLSYFKRSSTIGESVLFRVTRSPLMRLGLILTLVIALGVGVVWVGLISAWSLGWGPQLIHPLVACCAFVGPIILSIAALTILRRYPAEKFLTRPATIALGLLGLQLLLGLGAYVTRLRSPDDPQPLNPMVGITVAHVACGALVFATTIVMTLRAFRVLRPAVSAFELSGSEATSR